MTGSAIKITPRQLEALALVCHGLSNREIAARLEVTEDDIEYLVKRLFKVTGNRSRAQLAAWAVEHRLGDSGHA